jgi:hypothetical protein
MSLTLDVLHETPLQHVREQGLGLNFRVLNPEDGFRKDNALWFGKCDTCGEHVSNSLHNKFWAHTAVLEVKYHADGKTILSQKSMQIDYCPLGDIVVD